MKRNLFIFSILAALLLISCGPKAQIPEPDETEAECFIDGAKLSSADFAYFQRDLAEKNEEVSVSFSCKIFTVNKGENANLFWQVNTGSDYPMVSIMEVKKGNSGWKTVSGKANVSLKNSNTFYLSTYGSTISNFRIYIKDFELKVTTDNHIITYTIDDRTVNDFVMSDNNWLNDKVPSLRQALEPYFEYTGFSVSASELSSAPIRKGVVKHANTITMGNEFKPDSVFAWALGNIKQSDLVDFTGSNGTTIKVPSNIPSFASQDNLLKICKENNLKMRGHVLVWHSQTPDNFFKENYSSSGELVSKAEMDARQEWYIKTVLEHVQKWENDNNNGEHIIWAWDVVNEAVADGSSSLRSSGSNWYSIYKNYDFIVNAFRYANKYAPSDVQLCYNDYNCLENTKRSGMLTVLDKIIAAESDSVLPSRIDAMGIQAHISVKNTSNEFENAIKAFVSKGLDVQVTELDIATETSYSPDQLATAYKNLYATLIKNRKADGKHGVSSITIWGLNDETTWLNTPSQMQWHGNTTQYPLLFELNDDGEFVTKKAFDAVIEATKEAAN